MDDVARLGARLGWHGALGELARAAVRRAPYDASLEELTPLRADPLSAIPVLTAATACLIRPRWHRLFTAAAVGNYALTPQGWRRLLDAGRP